MYEAHDYGTSIVGVEILPIIMKFVEMFVIYNFILITRGICEYRGIGNRGKLEFSALLRNQLISLREIFLEVAPSRETSVTTFA